MSPAIFHHDVVTELPHLFNGKLNLDSEPKSLRCTICDSGKVGTFPRGKFVPLKEGQTKRQRGGEILCRVIILSGAEAVGAQRRTGSIEVGKMANFIAVDRDLGQGELKTWFEVSKHDGIGNESIILQPTPTDDPNDPLNWKTWEKGLNFTLALLYTLLVYGLIGVSTPTWEPMHVELGFSYETLTNSYAVGSAALCVGAIFLMPVAQRYGRRPIYILSTILQLGVGVWASKIQTVPDLMLINAFNCGLGALAEAIVQMTIADMFFVHQRGRTTSMYAWIVASANSLAPTAAGYITTGQGWRWVWIWVTILLGVCFVLFFFLYEETKFTRIIDGTPLDTSDPKNSDMHQLKVLSNSPGNRGKLPHALTEDDLVHPPRKTYIQRLKLWCSSPESNTALFHHVFQPFVMMTTVPAIMYTACFYGMITACYQISVTVIGSTMVTAPYNFTADQIGLISGIPGFTGSCLGAVLSGFFSDRTSVWLAKRNRGVYEPEMRIWLLLGFGIFMPIGLLIFGYGLGQGKPWPMLAVGLGIYTFGMTPASSVVLAYTTDAYANIIADAMVGIVFTRNVFATIFIFALTPWINAAGVANVFLTLALITALLIFLSGMLLIYGKRLRGLTAARYAFWSARVLDSRH
ncbi:hypothetical protein FE257_008181 [Aspergillus nanangensis]|uniref:Major facilitator superfamily (MFS) profile domain-containing protein n=1 Tax=Aspergillus nanangensis TaxID=2582783 RepID=A0AAD4CNI2_ASPNN|nr:hypothetical protein FE257_008181 [Aspergillus nanangensis]